MFDVADGGPFFRDTAPASPARMPSPALASRLACSRSPAATTRAAGLSRGRAAIRGVRGRRRYAHWTDHECGRIRRPLLFLCFRRSVGVPAEVLELALEPLLQLAVV